MSADRLGILVGPSSLLTLVSTVPPDWTPLIASSRCATIRIEAGNDRIPGLPADR